MSALAWHEFSSSNGNLVTKFNFFYTIWNGKEVEISCLFTLKIKYLPQYLSWAEIFHFRYFSPKYLVDVVEVPNGWSTSTCPFWMPMTTKWICFRYLDLSTSHYCKNNKNRLLSSWNKKFCYCLMRFLSAFGGKPARYKYNLLQGERRAL